MKRLFKIVLPGGELNPMKLGFYTYSDRRIIHIEAESLFDAYKAYPKALEIKEIDNLEILKNSLLFRGKDIGYFF